MARTRPIRDLAVAISVLTAVALPVSMPAEGERRDIAGWFPLVGLVFGIVLSGVAYLGHTYLPGTASTGAVVLLLVLAALTRFLHWNGLANVADAWFVPAEGRLARLSEAHIGALGAIAVAFAALAQVNAVIDLASTSQGGALLILAPLFSRAAATFSAWLGTPARTSGFGASMMGAPSFLGFAASLLSVAGGVMAAMLVFDAQVVPLMLTTAVAVLLAAGIPHLISMRFGGVTGDTIGASVVVTESAVLVCAAAISVVMPMIGAGS